jgi:hypothetical protein
MERIKKIFAYTAMALSIAFVAYLFSDNEPPAKPATEQAAPAFKPTPEMLAAVDPGEGFRADGWVFEMGELTERGIDIRVYWPEHQQVTQPMAEMMGEALVVEAVSKLREAGFDPRERGAKITYFLRQRLGPDQMIRLGAAGYFGQHDTYYFNPPN